MRKFFTSLSGFVLVFFLFLGNVHAQQDIAVKGKVTDAENGEPLIGVSIKVKGTSQGTSSDVNGNFNIKVPANGTLTFSYVGFKVTDVPVSGRSEIEVKLAASSQSLQEVVVVGYGTQRKIDVTGAVSQVKGEEISKQASVNPVSALQGKVAGVSITNNGAPGSAPQITVRGTGTIYGNVGVLYVVDGVWYDDINFLNPADIESMSILKDASSLSIYGIRAANGVVLVTTNRGKKGNAVINYNGTVGFQSVTNKVKMANGTEYATLINELSQATTQTSMFNDPSSFGKGTDWYGQILRNAFVTNHQVSINGGTDKSTYNLSLGYLDQDGIVETNNYKRYTARLTNDFQVNDFLKVGYNVSGTATKSKDINNSIFTQMFGAAPIVPVYYADGTYGDPTDFNLGGGNNYNPQVTIDYFDRGTKAYRLNGNVYADLNLHKNLTFRTSIGGDFGQEEVLNYSPAYKATLIQQREVSTLGIDRTEDRNWIIENTLTYKKVFGDHNLTVLAGQTAQRRKRYNINLSARNVPKLSDGDLYLKLGNEADRTVTDGGSLLTAASYFGRVNYSFKDRYLLNASFRADGASQFYGGGNLWGYFPSIGAGWIVTSEPFMQDQSLFSNLKVRASWGKIGNAGVPKNPTTVVVTQDAGYVAYFNGVAYTGKSIATLTPQFLNWEKTRGTDIGLEAGFLKDKLTVELDYYNKLTEDAIFDIPILLSLGQKSSQIIGNQADIRNRGLEFVATWRDKTERGLTYSVSGNLGYNQNKVASVVTGVNPIYKGGSGLANGSLATRTVLGRPIGEFFGYQVIGVFQNEQEVAASAQKQNGKPGDFKYADVNDDGVIDGKDRVPLGNPNPKFNFGLNTSFAYKNFDLALDIQGVAGVDVYNANVSRRYGNENFTKDFFDKRWHGEGTSNSYPSANIGSTTNATPNSFFVENGAYVRLRNVQLGYTLPKSVLGKWNAQRVRIFANAQNPLNIFSYKGFSPEIGRQEGVDFTPTARGIDASVYPLFATYNLGVNVTF